MKRLSKIGMVILSICILMLGGCTVQEPEPTPGQTGDKATPVEKEPVLQEMEWASQFGGLEGAAVLYIPEEERYLVYNLPIAQRRRPPALPLKSLRLRRHWKTGALCRKTRRVNGAAKRFGTKRGIGILTLARHFRLHAFGILGR